jgi:PAS domain S-box-containing protein
MPKQLALETALLTITKILGSYSGKKFFDTLTAEISSALKYDYVFISLLCDDKEYASTVSLSSSGQVIEGIKYKIKGTPCENVFANNACIYSHNVQHLFPEDALLVELDIESYAGIPIVDSNNSIIGMLGALHRTEIEESSQLLILLEILAVIISNEFSRQKQKQSARLSETAFETQESICITDISGNIVKVNKSFGRVTGYTEEEYIGKNIKLLSSGKHDKDFYSNMWDALISKGHWQGEIWNRRKNGEIFPEWQIINAVKNDCNEITHFVSTFVDISNLKLAEKTINDLVFYNPVTKLPNNILFKNRFNKIIRDKKLNHKYGALLLFMLDDFSYDNSSVIPEHFNAIQKSAANYLRQNINNIDTLGHIANNEFAILLCDIASDSAHAYHYVKVVAEKLLDGLEECCVGDKNETYIHVSVGITLITGENNNCENILEEAMAALNNALLPQHNSIQLFQPPMLTEVKRKLEIISSIKASIENNEFEIYLQPQVDFDKNIIGAEALLRWKHPILGRINPDEFIPIMEETGQIVDIGYWVLQESCKLIKRLGIDKQIDNLQHIAVNVSPVQLREADFVTQVLRIVNENKINPCNLELEITENTLIDNPQDIIDKLNELKNYGVKFSIDDFGTGYSSLHYLKDLPIYKVKIDRSFVKNAGMTKKGKALLDGIQYLSNSMGFLVLAEGVEKKKELEYLHSINISIYQGYYFYKPMPLIDFEHLVVFHQPTDLQAVANFAR